MSNVIQIFNKPFQQGQLVFAGDQNKLLDNAFALELINQIGVSKCIVFGANPCLISNDTYIISAGSFITTGAMSSDSTDLQKPIKFYCNSANFFNLQVDTIIARPFYDVVTGEITGRYLNEAPQYSYDIVVFNRYIKPANYQRNFDFGASILYNMSSPVITIDTDYNFNYQAVTQLEIYPRNIKLLGTGNILNILLPNIDTLNGLISANKASNLYYNSFTIKIIALRNFRVVTGNNKIIYNSSVKTSSVNLPCGTYQLSVFYSENSSNASFYDSIVTWMIQ